MTDEQARRIAQLNARRAQAGPKKTASQARSRNTASQARSGRTASQAKSGRTASQTRSGSTTRTAPGVKQHRARKSRAAVLGLSVATTAGLISGMWTQAALANNQTDGSAVQPVAAPQTTTTTTLPSSVTLQPDTTLQPVLIPGQNGQPDRIVYLVIRRPSSSSGSNSLGSSGTQTQTTQPPTQAVVPSTPRPTIQVPVTRSHGSR